MVTREIPPQDADLEHIGHVCDGQRRLDLSLLRQGPLQGIGARLHATAQGLCSLCKERPISTRPRKKPRKLCDRCTDAWTRPRQPVDPEPEPFVPEPPVPLLGTWGGGT